MQTSGRSLHAQEMDFNDIRTTLQALIAIYDNCNSLHTNAYDEAVTTPTAESVRRALAIQLIINREWGLATNENPNQGSFIIEELTDLVEEAVLAEFDRISERGGVLGAMETGYQRGRIQDESMLYEQRKHDGSLPIIGVNTFLAPDGQGHDADTGRPLELARSTDEEKQRQLQRLADFHERHAAERPAQLDRLRDAALAGDNLFAVLMDAVRVLQPRRDHPGPVRRGRPLPPQRLNRRRARPWPALPWAGTRGGAMVTVDRPHMPGYGLAPAGDGAGLLPWSWAHERLVEARGYWIATAGGDGRPHLAAVWGLWAQARCTSAPGGGRARPETSPATPWWR